VTKKLLFTVTLFLSIITAYPQLHRDTMQNKSLSERLDVLPPTEIKVVSFTLSGPIHPSVSPIPPNKRRQWIVGGGSVLLWAGSFVALNKAWYTDYDRTRFHFFNDNKEWQQVDKIGHVWSTYQLTRASTKAWKWTGTGNRKSVLLGAITGIAYQTIIEIQDAYSDKWGFSIADMGANFIGAGGYALQELTWREQRIAIKFSYWPYGYDADMIERRNQLFGHSFMERILKDYNGQAYWLSGNVRSFFPKSNWPAWLNVAVGYRANGMLGGRENVWTDNTGNIIERKDLARVRHFYLSPDVDFTKIKTNRKLVKKLFFVLNAVKIPAPAIGINSRGKVKLHALAF
jgi:hypothetical protein